MLMEKILLTRSKILLLFAIFINYSLAYSSSEFDNSIPHLDFSKSEKLTIDGTKKIKSFFDVNATLTQVTATCANNGSITAVASGATSSPSLFIFKITDGPTANGQTYPFVDQFHESTFTFIDLYPGVYEVTIEDSGDLSNPPFVGNITVIDETEVINFSMNSTPPNCPGESTGTLSVSVSDGVGPYQYQIFDGPAGTTTAPITISNANYTFNNLPSGNYRIRVFDVCGDFQTRNHTINSTSSSSINLLGAGITRTSCTEAVYRVRVFGISSGTYTYEVVGGAPLGYTSSNTTGDFTLPINQAPYTFSVTGSCGQTDTYTHNNPSSSVSFSASDKTCTDWDLTLNPFWMVGPFNYVLNSSPAGYTGPLTSTTGFFENVAYGNYSYTVSDSCGNVVSGTAEEQLEVLEISSATRTEPDPCNVGQGTVEVRYNGADAIGPVTFELTTVPATFTGNTGPQNNDFFDQLTPGDYVVTGTDACGNSDTYAFEFKAEDALNVEFDIVVNQGCIDSHSVSVSINTNFNTGAKLLILRNATSGNAVQTRFSFSNPIVFNNVSGGEYYITYRLSTGCNENSENFTVAPYEQPKLTPLSSYTCTNNGFVSISGITEGGVGPFTYSLINTANNQIIATNTECYFSNQDASLSYAVRIEDNCGNSSSAQVSPVAVGLGLVFQGQTCSPLGNPFSLYLREYMGVSYTWTFPDGTIFNGSDPRSTIGIITSSDYGNYTIVASTDDGCRTQTLELDFNDCPIGPVNATIDFDGVDDYLDTAPFITNWTEGTIMGWVKINHDSTGNLPNLYSVAGQESMRLSITNGRTPAFVVITQDQVTASSNFPSNNIEVQPDAGLGITLENNLWYHLTGVFNSTDQSLKLYVNGEQVGETINSQLNSELITQNFNGTPHVYSQREFTVGRYPTNTSSAGFGHFEGDIDEVRVFEKALTEAQIQQMVYQEIENNSGVLRGKIVPKDIEDLETNSKVSWSDLKGYYPMTNIIGVTTTDFSLTGNNLTLHNITTILEQTAPMPYTTVSDGDWTNESTWLHGDIWDIDDATTNKDWSIVHIQNDVFTSNSHSSLGLIIDETKTLTVNGENEINNSWYLELNGTLDLQDDCQLIQTEFSDLVTSVNGKILRRQEGTANPYWYNYWSSPVGATGVSSFFDNNTASNNTNNTPFSLHMIKDDAGFNCQFTSNYTGNGNISTYWLYTFINGNTYWDWASISPSSSLTPGVGYTQKGTGTGAQEQKYIFEGKPNNGTILIAVDDVGGLGSVAGVSKTEYLLGNPYASAIDVHKFIDDNEGVISGSLQLWQQWGGTSHNLNEYHGGYAQVNKTGSVRARQFVGLSGSTTGGVVGVITPSRYLPVGQGFIVEIEDDGNLPFDGTVEFNNSQRIFIKESDADGTYEAGASFSKSSNGKSSKSKTLKTNDVNDGMKRIRLEFNSTSGPETKHELLLGFSDFTTDGYDYGFDASNTEISNNALNLNLEGVNMNIQAYAPISKDKIIPLNFVSSGDNSFEIKISELENIEEDQDIYLKDNLIGNYFNLKNQKAYAFSSGQGIFNERFEIVFQDKASALSLETVNIEKNYIYYNKDNNTLYVKKLEGEVTKFTLYNISGQSIMELTGIDKTTLDNGLQLPSMSSGAYIAVFRTNANNVISKKLIKP